MPAKCSANRAASIVADVMITRKSDRLGKQPLQVADEEVDVQRPLVGLVENDRVVLLQQRIALCFGQKDAVGHELDVALRADRFGEADLETDLASQRRAELLGNPRGDAAGGDPPRLRMADQPGDAASHFQADLGQLRRLAGAGLAANDHYLVVANGGRDFLPPGGDRQLHVIADIGDRPRPRFAAAE